MLHVLLIVLTLTLSPATPVQAAIVPPSSQLCATDADCKTAAGFPFCLKNPVTKKNQCFSQQSIYTDMSKLPQHICGGKPCPCALEGKTNCEPNAQDSICASYAEKPSIAVCINHTSVSTGTGPVAIPTEPETSAQAAPQYAPAIQIDIPGLTFEEKITAEASDEGGQDLTVPYLATYINAVYKYAIGLGVLIAIITVMFAGFRWMTSFGNAKAISDAKQMVTNAVLGLALLFGSYSVLYIVNPNLVELKSLTIFSPDAIQFSPLEEAESHASDSAESTQAEQGSEEPGPITPGQQIKLPIADDGRMTKYPKAPILPILAAGNSYLTGERPCTVPLPSSKTTYSNLPMDHSLLGLLDCNISKLTKNKKREPSQITHVVLHQGWSNPDQHAMVAMWFRNYNYGTVKKCKDLKKVVNGLTCNDKDKFWIPPRVKDTPIGSHYAIKQNGTVAQLGDELHIFNHCCKLGNEKGIGIDLEYRVKDGKNIFTDAQYESLAKLIKNLSSKYGFPLGDSAVRGHCEIGSHADPPNFKLNKLGNLLGVKFDLAYHSSIKHKNTGKEQCSWDPSEQ